jgi:transcriptional regulator with XRE-family HTH domain
MKLKEYLTINRMTVTEFANLSSVSRASIFLYVSGKRKPSLISARKIEKITNGIVSVDELMTPSK